VRNRSGKAASSLMFERSESSDLFDSAESVESPTSLFDLQIPDPAFEIEVLIEFALLVGDSETIHLDGEPTLIVPHSERSLCEAYQAEGDICAGLTEIVSPSLGTVQEPSAQNSEWKMFLRREDSEVALGHGNFL